MFRWTIHWGPVTSVIPLSIDASVVDMQHLRQRSKALLGNRYRLEIAAAIAGCQTGFFRSQELADGLGVPHNVVSQQAQGFVLGGLWNDVPHVTGLDSASGTSAGTSRHIGMPVEHCWRRLLTRLVRSSNPPLPREESGLCGGADTVLCRLRECRRNDYLSQQLRPGLSRPVSHSFMASARHPI